MAFSFKREESAQFIQVCNQTLQQNFRHIYEHPVGSQYSSTGMRNIALSFRLESDRVSVNQTNMQNTAPSFGQISFGRQSQYNSNSSQNARRSSPWNSATKPCKSRQAVAHTCTFHYSCVIHVVRPTHDQSGLRISEMTPRSFRSATDNSLYTNESHRRCSCTRRGEEMWICLRWMATFLCA